MIKRTVLRCTNNKCRWCRSSIPECSHMYHLCRIIKYQPCNSTRYWLHRDRRHLASSCRLWAIQWWWFRNRQEDGANLTRRPFSRDHSEYCRKLLRPMRKVLSQQHEPMSGHYDVPTISLHFFFNNLLRFNTITFNVLKALHLSSKRCPALHCKKFFIVLIFTFNSFFFL